MWLSTGLVMVLALAPAQTGRLAIQNFRATYGVLGPERRDNRLLPGDTLIICYDIVGMRAGEDGQVHYSIRLDVTDPGGNVRFRQEPEARAAKVPSTDSVPAMARLHVGLDQPPGKYTLKVTVTDLSAQASADVSRTYEVLPRGFGLVNISASGTADTTGAVVPFRAGKPGVVNLTAVGFGRAPSGQPDIRVTMEVRDAQGRPALAQPSVGQVGADVPAKALSVPMQFQLQLDRPGDYTLDLRGEDRVGGGESRISLPITVSPSR